MVSPVPAATKPSVSHQGQARPVGAHDAGRSEDDDGAQRRLDRAGSGRAGRLPVQRRGQQSIVAVRGARRRPFDVHDGVHPVRSRSRVTWVDGDRMTRSPPSRPSRSAAPRMLRKPEQSMNATPLAPKGPACSPDRWRPDGCLQQRRRSQIDLASHGYQRLRAVDDDVHPQLAVGVGFDRTAHRGLQARRGNTGPTLDVEGA